MVYPGLRDEPLNLGFQLAFFIHGDKDLALDIAGAALEKLDAAGSVQDKRRYYNPRGGIRRRISMPDLQLLQRLVYAESERHERLKEDAGTGAPNQKMLVKHFIKHLVKITTRFITETSPTVLPGASPRVSPNASPLLAGTSPTPAPTRKPTPRADEVVAFNLPANPSLRGENLRRVEREE